MTEETVFAGAAPRRIGPGTRLNDLYEIDALVATGGMGEVYRGHAIETGDVVAIKTIKPEFAGSGPALALFRKEASALHNLYHEAIIRYYVFSIDKPLGLPYLAMEFVSGEALSDIAARGSLPVEAVDTLRRRLASGLAAAHELGIIHRDVSPDNVILPDGNPARAKIIDFGIARSSLGGATVIGDGFAGKYGYVSPEQLGLYGGEVTPRSDIYSLGLVLAEAALGRRLDMGQNPVDVVEKRRHVPDLAGLDARLLPLIDKMLQPEPAARIGSMAEVVAWSGAAQAATSPSAPAKPKGPSRPASGRSRIPLIATAAVATITVLAGGSYWALQDGDAGRRQMTATESGSRLEERVAPARAPIPPIANPAPPDTSAPSGSSTPPGTQSPQRSDAPAARNENPAPSLETPSARTDPLPSAPPPARDPIWPPSPPGRVTGTQPSVRPDNPAVASNPAPVALPSQIPAQTSPAQTSPAQPAPSPPPPSGGNTGNLAAIVPPPPAGRSASLEQVADYIRDYRGGDCLYLGPVSVGAREASIEAYGSDAPVVSTFDSAFTSAFGFDPQIQLRLVTAAQCSVVDALARQGVQRRQRLPKLTLARDRVRSGDELAGTLDLPEDGNAELFLVDDEGAVHSLARNAKRTGRRLSFSVRLQSSGPAKPQLVVGVTSGESLGFLKFGRGTQAADLFRVVTDEVARPNAPIGVAVRYLRLGE